MYRAPDVRGYRYMTVVSYTVPDPFFLHHHRGQDVVPTTIAASSNPYLLGQQRYRGRRRWRSGDPTPSPPTRVPDCTDDHEPAACGVCSYTRDDGVMQ